MQSAWSKHLKDEEAQRFRSSVIGSKLVLDRAAEILQEKLNAISSEEMNSKEYDNPNWAFKQAHLNGRRAELKEVIRLLTLDQKDTNEYFS